MYLPPSSTAYPSSAFRLDGPRAVGALAPLDALKRRGGGGEKLSAEDRRLVAQLARRDRAVRAHERGPVAIGGSLVHANTCYTYQRGPDGGYYAIGGEVAIDLAAGPTPAASSAGFRAIRVSPLAPADSSTTHDLTAPHGDSVPLEPVAIADRHQGFALAVARFYLAVAAGVGPGPSVDLFA